MEPLANEPVAAPEESVHPLILEEDAHSLLLLSSRDHLRVGFRGIGDRYREHPLGVTRFLDPVRSRIVSVGTLLAYDNWLLRWMDPSVRDLEVPTTPWQCLHRGRRASIKPTFTWTQPDGQRVLEIVVRHGDFDVAARKAELGIVCQAHGTVPSIRTIDDIRKNVLLLENLDRARQALCNQLTRQSYEQGRAAILSILPSARPVAKGGLLTALRWSCPGLTEQCEDSLLFSMHREGSIKLNLEEVRYGTRTIVRAL